MRMSDLARLCALALWAPMSTALAAASSPVQTSAPGYTFEVPRSPGATRSFAYGIGEDGTVLGRSTLAPAPTNPTIWAAGNVRRIGLFAGTQGSARAINASGVVAGSTNGSLEGERAFLWRAGVFQPLDVLGVVRTEAFDIADSGEVAGLVYSGGQYRAARWDSGGVGSLVPLPPNQASSARAINESGVVVGELFEPGGCWRGFVQDESGLSLVQPLAGDSCSYLADINDLGVMVGGSQGSLGHTSGVDSGVIWDGSIVEVLPRLGGLPDIYATRINNRRQVVGSAGYPRPFLYQEHQIHPLEELAAPLGWQYGSVYDINDRGQIVGVGFDASIPRAFLLTPCIGNFDRDPDIDLDDLDLFYRAFDQGHEWADIDANGTVDTIDEQLFLQAWNNGC